MSTELYTVMHRTMDHENFTKCNRKNPDLRGKNGLITQSYQQYTQNYPQLLGGGETIKLYKR